MTSVRNSGNSHEPEPQPERLSLRWAVIIAVAAVAAVAVSAAGGLPAAIGTFLAVAGGMHIMVA
ncbi:hypothetical protein [Streptomyces flaveus]|uniref:Uncharacterized protein n=1 Tax=Streptomyces flaveus TaxID=66370 RepID=A0A917VCI2_9ACTN|nr:hypothetical protein [Streptomyces flaveus]GGK64233.1 hypothetical protein GCM10010094_26420 [Streptomyces flaveus]